MRLKAKNFIQKQKENDELIEQQQKQEASKSIDPNNFTCKFCNGSIDQKSLKFVHEKFCLVANKNAPQSTEPAPPKEQEKSKSSQKKANKKITDCSTQGESEEGTLEEDKQIEEFAKKLDMIHKLPPMKFVGTN